MKKKIIVGILMIVLAVGVCLAAVGCGEESLPGVWRGTRDERYVKTLEDGTIKTVSVSETCVWRFLDSGECFLHYVQKYNGETEIEVYQKGTYSTCGDMVITTMNFKSDDGHVYEEFYGSSGGYGGFQFDKQRVYKLSREEGGLEFSYPIASSSIPSFARFAPYVICYKFS